MSNILKPKTDKGLQEEQRRLAQQQSDVLAQQAADKSQLSKKLNKQRIDALRARFGSFGASPSDSDSGLNNPVSDTAGNLFSRLTGR